MWRGKAGGAWLGSTRQGRVKRGRPGEAWHGKARLARWSRRGEAWHGGERHVMVWQGKHE